MQHQEVGRAIKDVVVTPEEDLEEVVENHTEEVEVVDLIRRNQKLEEILKL